MLFSRLETTLNLKLNMAPLALARLLDYYYIPDDEGPGKKNLLSVISFIIEEFIPQKTIDPNFGYTSINKPTTMKRVKPGKLAEEEDRKQDIANDLTKKRIREHLSDINDEITEDDIKNVRVPGHQEKAIKKKKKDDSALDDETKDDKPNLTTWNLLEE